MPTPRSKLAGRSRSTQAITGALMAVALVAGVAGAVATISIDRVDAVWAVNGEVGDSSLVIPIRAAHPGCPSWSTLGGLVVNAVESDEAVTITATFPDQRAEAPCSWMGTAMGATVKLDRPLGNRAVIDGGTGGDPATPVSIAFHTGQSPDGANSN